MKSFNEFTNLQKLIESSSKQELLILLESSSEALKNYIRNALETIDDVDRLKALGNGVVPQFSELVGRLIIRSLIADTLVFDPEITKEDHPQ